MRHLLLGTPVRRPARRHLYFQRCWGRATLVQPARSKPAVHPKTKFAGPYPIPIPREDVWNMEQLPGSRRKGTTQVGDATGVWGCRAIGKAVASRAPNLELILCAL